MERTNANDFRSNLKEWVEEIAVWILLTNIEQSESLAEKKVDEWSAEMKALKACLQVFPDSGDRDNVEIAAHNCST
jgi:hypothetical protein